MGKGEKMEFELTVLDRITLIQLLEMAAPKMGSRLYYRQFNQVAAAVSFSESEQKKLEWDHDRKTGSIRWNNAKAQPKKVVIPESVLADVVEELKKLDKAGQLKPEHFIVYEKLDPREELEPEEEPVPEPAPDGD